MRKWHLPEPAVKTATYHLYIPKTGISQPWEPVWFGDMCYAPLLVSVLHKSDPDWRFYLGFGQLFELGDAPFDHYCAGFVYSSKSARAIRGMLVFLSPKLSKSEAMTAKTAKILQSIEESPFRLIPISDFVGEHLPLPLSTITDLPESSKTRGDFFRHVTALFTSGGTLPYVYGLSKKEVLFNLDCSHIF